jgi:hypothetical protein
MMLVHVSAVSRSMDASLLALADLTAAAADAGTDYRVIGGQMVALHVAAAGVADRVPDRDTADADAGVPIGAAETQALHDVLVAAGYAMQTGDRLVRESRGLMLTIDVLLPAYRSRRRENVKAGPFVATEAGGLGYALGQPPFVVEVQATLTDGTVLSPFPVLLPGLLAALIIKGYAWHDRGHPRDALDVWRLLVAADAAGIHTGDWPDGPTGRAGAELLRSGFGSTVARGTVSAAAGATDRAVVAALLARVVGGGR